MTRRPGKIEPLPLDERSPGELVRLARTRHRLTQKQLAVRAGTTQSAVARIEGDRTSPTIRTLVGLFKVMEEDFVFGSRPHDSGIDLTINRRNLELTSTERVERALGSAEDQRRAAKGEKGRPS